METCPDCGGEHEPGSPQCVAIRIGTTVASKYELTGVIGAGGMGVIYRARHLVLGGKEVAIKMLHKELVSDRQIVERFRREARAAASLNHDGIIAINDLVEDSDGSVYMEMELLRGESVADALKAGPFDPERAVGVAWQALAALQVAHSQGLVHRDLKPDNLFLAEDSLGVERVKILDFGIAMVGSELRLTHVGSLMGSPSYMAPEQALDASKVDARSDIYSLGATLLEMLTGRSPVEGNQSLAQALVAIANGEIERDPRSYRSDVPGWIAEIVTKSLAKDPSNRFGSASAMRMALESGARSAGFVVPPGARVAGPTGVDAPTRVSAELAPMAGPEDATSTVHSEPPPAMDDVKPFDRTVLHADSAQTAPAVAPPAGGTATSSPSRLAWGLVPAGLAVLAGVAGVGWFIIRGGQAEGDGEPAGAQATSSASAAPATSASASEAQPATPPGMVRIAGGSFWMGSTNAEIQAAYVWCQELAGAACRRSLYEREQPRRRVTISSFWIDAHEVTATEYAERLNAGSDLHLGDAAKPGGSRRVSDRAGAVLAQVNAPDGGVVFRDGRYTSSEGSARLPMVWVSWHGARDYCEWRKKRLPTEAEWEFTARGSESRRFAWGSHAPRCDGVAFARAPGKTCENGPRGLAPVGQSKQDVTPSGVYDLGGNAAEWVFDRFEEHYVSSCEPNCVDPRVGGNGAAGPLQRVLRGGYFDEWPEALRAAGRGRAEENALRANLGFRCAKSARSQ